MIRTTAATAFLSLITSVLPVTGVSAAAVSETLAVSVTVVRSCVVEARAIDRRSSSVRLGCSVGQHSQVLVGNGLSSGQLASLGAPLQVDAQLDSSASVGTRTVTLNF
jgi:hypothetical protein